MLYSIWIIPPEPYYSQIEQIIATLSVKYGGPAFEPHMTLLGSIKAPIEEIKEKLQGFARHADQLFLSSGSVSFSTTYFQSVLLRINSTAQIMRCNVDLKRLFNKPNDVFMPHISLMYGDHDMEIREEATKSVSLQPFSWNATEVALTPFTQDPNGWEHFLRIPFRK